MSGDAPRRESAAARLARRLLAPLAALLLRALAWSWRIETRGVDPFVSVQQEGVVAALWHCNLLVGAGKFRDSGIHVPISRSRDGEHIAAVVTRMGLGEPLRGSSSRGGVAVLKAMVRLVRSGRMVVVLPDGPRGPARQAKPGIVALARSTGCPIHSMGFAARPAIRFASWDRTLLPLPFARVACVFGEPLPIERGDAHDRAAAQAALASRLDAVTAEAEAMLRRP